MKILVKKAFHALSFTAKSGKFQKEKDEEYVTSMHVYILHIVTLRRDSMLHTRRGVAIFIYFSNGFSRASCKIGKG